MWGIASTQTIESILLTVSDTYWSIIFIIKIITKLSRNYHKLSKYGFRDGRAAMVYSMRLPQSQDFDLRHRFEGGVTTSKKRSTPYDVHSYQGPRSRQRWSTYDLVHGWWTRIKKKRTYNGHEYGLLVGMSEQIEGLQIVPQRGRELTPEGEKGGRKIDCREDEGPGTKHVIID
jgi:hypothetical protein